MKVNNFRKSVIIASLTGLLAVPAAAVADNAVKTQDSAIKVSYADLNIRSKQGISALYKRLQNASEELCGPLSYSKAGNLNLLTQNRQCYQETLSSAVDKVGSEALSELHNG
ncbi:MAG: UrcA family protein [Gammaproteobacteria bacterium]|nr:UrcA family protein [Gammaproteobacteria bacterium]